MQLAYGPRVPLLLFGGPVTQGIDSRWDGHISIGKTVLDLLALPPLGVPHLDDAPSLADLADPAATPAHPPPAYKSTITQPTAPSPTPTPTPTPTPVPPPPTTESAAVGPVLLRDGSTLPAARRPTRQLTNLRFHRAMHLRAGRTLGDMTVRTVCRRDDPRHDRIPFYGGQH